MHDWLRVAGKGLLQTALRPHRFMWRLSDRDKGVALTFDDGPHPNCTEPILDVLAQYEVKATFFVIGRNAKAHPDIVRRIVRDGHSIGVHGYEHLDITTLSQSELEVELDSCRDTIYEITGKKTSLFRPPRGRVDLRSMYAAMRLGYCVCHWSKTYSDYLQDGSAPLARRLLTNMPVAKDIILLHDTNPHTVTALTEILPIWATRIPFFSSLSHCE